jgi:hypothetical protein
MDGIEVLEIILYIVMALAYTAFFIAIIRVGTGGRFGWLAAAAAIAIGILLIVYLVVNVEKIEPAAWAQILLTFGLVAVTGFYAWRTHAMSEEMREQRLSEARPYLLLRLEGEAVQWDKDEKEKPPDRNFPVTIRNVGKGPATNLWAALWSPKKTYFGDSKGYLAPGEEWQVTISRASTDMVELGIEKEGWLPELRKSIKKEYAGVVAVKYNDIHNRAWGSYLCLERHVDVEYFVIEEEQNIVELKNPD